MNGTVSGPNDRGRARGSRSRSKWRNELEGGVSRSPGDGCPVSRPTPTASPVQCLPGLERRASRTAHGGRVDRPPPSSHLHGGLTPASYDGLGPRTSSPRAQGRPFDHLTPMDQRAAMLLVSRTTSWASRSSTCYAGLGRAVDSCRRRGARRGSWGLPEGPPFEVPLLIQDRNFDLDDEGNLTGRLIHKDRSGRHGVFFRRSPSSTARSGRVARGANRALTAFRVLNGFQRSAPTGLFLLHEGEPAASSRDCAGRHRSRGCFRCFGRPVPPGRGSCLPASGPNAPGPAGRPSPTFEPWARRASTAAQYPPPPHSTERRLPLATPRTPPTPTASSHIPR